MHLVGQLPAFGLLAQSEQVFRELNLGGKKSGIEASDCRWQVAPSAKRYFWDSFSPMR